MSETDLKLEYNSNREKLMIPEYGRNVQKMLAYAHTIEDKEQRQLFVEMVVRLMEQMQTSARPSKELTDKLWNHAFMIGGYDLDVQPPEDVIIVKHEGRVMPPKLEYPHTESRFKHYGFHVQQLIDKAKKMEDEEKKAWFIMAIASYMKLAYRTWHKEHHVNDEVIKQDLKNMSGGVLVIPEETPLDFLQYNLRKPKRSNNHGDRGSKRSKGGRHRRKR